MVAFAVTTCIDGRKSVPTVQSSLNVYKFIIDLNKVSEKNVGAVNLWTSE